MTLRQEYQAIADEVCVRRGFTFSGEPSKAMKEVAERCQELADKPPKMLTDAELADLFRARMPMWATREFMLARDIIAAHIAKQKEPEVRKVKINIYQSKDEGFHCFSGSHHGIPSDWKLIDSFEREVTL